MPETPQQTARQPRPRRRVSKIRLPNGKTLKPRADFALMTGECERTVKRRGYPTTKIGGVVFVEVEGALQMLADSVKRRDEPKPKKHGRRAVSRRS
jgi:hypothetical protein